MYNEINSVDEVIRDCVYLNTIRQCQKEIADMRNKLNPIILEQSGAEVERADTPKTLLEIELGYLLNSIKNLSSDIRI